MKSTLPMKPDEYYIAYYASIHGSVQASLIYKTVIHDDLITEKLIWVNVDKWKSTRPSGYNEYDLTELPDNVSLGEVFCGDYVEDLDHTVTDPPRLLEEIYEDLAYKMPPDGVPNSGSFTMYASILTEAEVLLEAI